MTTKFTCSACKLEFEAEAKDVQAAGGHLCIAATHGLSQREALEKLGFVPESEEPNAR